MQALTTRGPAGSTTGAAPFVPMAAPVTATPFNELLEAIIRKKLADKMKADEEAAAQKLLPRANAGHSTRTEGSRFVAAPEVETPLFSEFQVGRPGVEPGYGAASTRMMGANSVYRGSVPASQAAAYAGPARSEFVPSGPGVPSAGQDLEGEDGTDAAVKKILAAIAAAKR